jgi:RNA-directed DNA polymerase
VAGTGKCSSRATIDLTKQRTGEVAMDLFRKVLKTIEEQAAGARPTTQGPPTPGRPAQAPARPSRPRTLTVDQLGARLGLTAAELNAVPIAYRPFQVPKRGGGWRDIQAPEPPLRDVQRRIVRRLLQKIESHPGARGVERGRSTVENAALHAARLVVLRMDVKDFFGSTSAQRIEFLYANLGWNEEATALLLRLTTHNGSLPQGAPTSPRLSNLVNRRLDERLNGFAAWMGARYTRYADDLTFSFDTDDAAAVHSAIRLTKNALADDGYALHERRKLHIRRPYERQLVSGLVVNTRPQLPRETRRWLRAVEHHSVTGRPMSLSPVALDGWRAYRSMVEAANQG